MACEARISIERLEQREPCFGSVHHGGGDGAVQDQERVIRHAEEQAVERQDLGPIGVLGPRASSWTAAIAAWSW